jgi:hypothetical protein
VAQRIRVGEQLIASEQHTLEQLARKEQDEADALPRPFMLGGDDAEIF